LKEGPILITGGCGFLGTKLAHLLLSKYPNRQIILADIVKNSRLDSLKDKVKFIEADLNNPQICRQLVTPNISIIFHLASLVSGGAEKNFEAGLKANIWSTIHLLEACRLQRHRPKFIFTSSIAVFGGEKLPDKVTDWTYQHPQNSYGVAKVIGEQLINDYSRKRYIDGRGVRLPAVIVRDTPNTALSGYLSALCREPLNGRDYICPVKPKTNIPIIGIQKAIEFLFELSELKENKLGDFRTVNGRGISPTAGEIVEVVYKCASPEWSLGKISFNPDPGVQKIIDSWPKWIEADRALSLGLPGNDCLDTIIRDYISFDLI